MFFKEKITEKEFSSLGKGKARIIKIGIKQKGKESALDKKRTALPAGKRISKFGKIYYEYRKNRSDLEGGKL